MRLVVCAVLVAGCASAPPAGPLPASPPPPGQATDGASGLKRGADASVVNAGVSADEADRRLVLQGAGGLGALQERLATERPGTFGGLWVVRQPEYGAVVAFTESADSTLALYLPDAGLPFPVRAVTARYSVDELRAAQVLAGAMLRRLGVDNQSAIYLPDRIEVVVADAGPVRTALARGDLWLHPAVEVVEGGFIGPE